eukprot:scaffold2332_cov260-Prasinococcus_capsulatus_cf.AAC.3
MSVARSGRRGCLSSTATGVPRARAARPPVACDARATASERAGRAAEGPRATPAGPCGECGAARARARCVTASDGIRTARRMRAPRGCCCGRCGHFWTGGRGQRARRARASSPFAAPRQVRRRALRMGRARAPHQRHPQQPRDGRQQTTAADMRTNQPTNQPTDRHARTA